MCVEVVLRCLLIVCVVLKSSLFCFVRINLCVWWWKRVVFNDFFNVWIWWLIVDCDRCKVFFVCVNDFVLVMV